MDDAERKYEEIKDLFKRMSNEMCEVVEFYYIWNTLTFSRSIPEVGKKSAEKNAEIITLYKDFFVPIEQSLLKTFIIGLVKFFDNDSRALSIANLKREIKKNKEIFTKELFEKTHPNLVKLGLIRETYQPISEETIQYIQKIKKKHKKLIGILKKIRTKQFAHTDMAVIENKDSIFVPNEVKQLINDVQEILNKLSVDFDDSSTVWDFLKDESINTTKFLLENLKKHEELTQKSL
jgi:hypothetical protein